MVVIIKISGSSSSILVCDDTNKNNYSENNLVERGRVISKKKRVGRKMFNTLPKGDTKFRGYIVK